MMCIKGKDDFCQFVGLKKAIEKYDDCLISEMRIASTWGWSGNNQVSLFGKFLGINHANLLSFKGNKTIVLKLGK